MVIFRKKAEKLIKMNLKGISDVPKQEYVFTRLFKFGNYNSGLIIDAVNILKEIRKDNRNYMRISKKLSLDEKYVELIMDLLSYDILDYGTSPRNCWLTPDGEWFLKYMEKKGI